MNRNICQNNCYIFAYFCVLTDKADIFRKSARSKLRFITAGGTIKQEHQRQVRPPPVYLLQKQIIIIIMIRFSLSLYCVVDFSVKILCVQCQVFI